MGYRRFFRWCNQLHPDVKKAPFSEWEQAVVVKVGTCGPLVRAERIQRRPSHKSGCCFAAGSRSTEEQMGR
jgi:hypothetical protein